MMDNNDLANDLKRINLEPVLSILKDFKVFESFRRPEMNSVKYYWLIVGHFVGHFIKWDC